MNLIECKYCNANVKEENYYKHLLRIHGICIDKVGDIIKSTVMKPVAKHKDYYNSNVWDKIEELKNEIALLKDLNGDLRSENAQLEDSYRKQLNLININHKAEISKLMSEFANSDINLLKKENERLSIKNTEVNKDLLKQNNLIQALQEQTEMLKSQVDNLRTFLRNINPEIVPKHFKEKYEKLQLEINENANTSSSISEKLDGSYGLHHLRENGRFGSHPSFDNYDSEYNPKYD